jgi:fermentation-respiration switch protein FrsA (DUF1100 family)
MLSWHDSAKKEPFTLSSQGIDLACEYIQGDSKKCLIRVHGYSQNMMLSVAYARAFHNESYSVIVYDQRAFGKSGGDVCTVGIKEPTDLLEVVKWARSKLGEDVFIGLHGESMGAMVALEAASMDGGIGFVIADSAPDSALTMFSETDMHPLPAGPTRFFTRLVGKAMGFDFSLASPISHLDKVAAPVMFIHGEADTTVPIRSSKDMFAKANGRPWRLSTYPDAKHGWSIVLDTKRYEREEIEFAREAEALKGLR